MHRLLLLAAVALVSAPLAAQSFGAGARLIRSGETLTGTLTPSDPTLDDGSHYDLYRYDGSPGETLVLTLRSDDFDAYLIGGALGREGIEDTVTDDDGAGGTDAQLTIEIGATGQAAIQANSLSAGATGRYTIFAESLGGGRGPAVAQGGLPVLRVGDTVTGRLNTTDATLDDGSHYQDFAISGAPGQQVAVTMRSTAFDAYLQGGPVVGGAVQPDASDDDSGGGTDAQMVATLDGNGTYGIRVNSLTESQTGPFTLSAEAVSGPTPGPSGPVAGATPIRAGQSLSGALAAGDDRLGDDSYADAYVYEGSPNESVEFVLASQAFDVYLLGGPTLAAARSAETTDDDGAGGTDARLRVTTGADGRYVVLANSYAAGDTGPYLLTARSLSGAAPALPGVTALALGRSVSGRLDASDPTLDDGTHFDFYTYTGSAGEDVVITLTSSDFDPYMLFQRIVGDELELVAQDDDGGEGTSSRIRATLDASGTYVVVANSYAAGATGAYTVSIGRPGAVAQQEAEEAGYATLELGRVTSGRLEPGDTVLDDDSFADLYVFEGTPGDAVTVTMRSTDLDAYLSIGTIEGSELAVVGRDNDSGGGRDARVRFTVGASGLYAVQANSLSGGETGAYTVLVERAEAPPPTAEGPARRGAETARFAGKWAPLSYETTANYDAYRTLVRDGRHLERISERLGAEYPVPKNIPIRFSECTEPGADFPYINAYYRPTPGDITFCYELMADIVGRLGQAYPQDQLAGVVDGAYDFVMLHEVGHALTDQLEIPITGREEDVADQFATLALLRQGDRGALAALHGVDYLYRLGGGREGGSGGRPMLADEHSLGPQRLYNVQCWVLGSDVDKYAWLVFDEDGNERTDEYGLPLDRARRCAAEYAQMEKSFEVLMEFVYRERD
ncbi:DUF4344 domain-containing metallopeptidase [Rubrivirga sp. IMCC45206]|uniref:DUF4344 domain-containing metallopeptidase n=1 Tax=Rubrivirga sp. IMCC45206 TaxID=3391614 RepID=UPI00398FA7B4